MFEMWRKIRKNAWPPNFDNHSALYQSIYFIFFLLNFHMFHNVWRMCHQNDLERSKIIFYIYNCLYLTCDISEHIWVKILDLLIVFWSNKVVGVKWNQGIQYWKHYFYIYYIILCWPLSPSWVPHNFIIILLSLKKRKILSLF